MVFFCVVDNCSGSHSTNNRKGHWFKFNDTVIEEFDLTDTTIETECFGGNYKAKVFENSECGYNCCLRVINPLVSLFL